MGTSRSRVGPRASEQTWRGQQQGMRHDKVASWRQVELRERHVRERALAQGGGEPN